MRNVKIVIGSNFGDEGKGLMTDYFAHQAISRGEKTCVVLSNGGAQRGHTVITPDGQKHVFKHLGSGTFAGADTIIPQTFYINPIFFEMEYSEILPDANIYINPHCRVTTPWHMLTNQMIEDARGENRHGSCGMGVWETKRGTPIYWSEINTDKYDALIELTKAELREKIPPNAPDGLLKTFEDNRLKERFKKSCEYMRKYTMDYSYPFNVYDTVIFENGQGLLLDSCLSTRYSTPSRIGIYNPANLIYSYISYTPANVEICYVSRTYMTRHGNGRFDTECSKEEFPGILDDCETNVWNKYQGEFRYGRLDLDGLKKRVWEDYWQFNKPCKLSMAFTHFNEHQIDTDQIDWCDNLYISDGLTRDSIIIKKEN